jgi:hypothetical protein
MHFKKINNIVLFFIFIFLFQPYNFLYSKNIDDTFEKKYCNNVDPTFFFDTKIPAEISIEVKNPKKWAKNLFSLFIELNSKEYKTGEKDWYSFNINKKYKKKYKSEITFKYKNPNFECKSNAQINITGNLWWHLDWSNGYPFSSLKVNLIDGHLNNSTIFNLLIPKSRTSKNQDINLELFTTTLLNKLKLLAPKSYLIKVKINGNTYNKYLYQEEIAKEFLESRGLVEGPLLEGDHRFTTDLAFKGWRGDLGLAKIINPNYSVREKAHIDVSFNALSIMNNIYLDNYEPSTDPNTKKMYEYTINYR